LLKAVLIQSFGDVVADFEDLGLRLGLAGIGLVDNPGLVRF
jgi:hypothetical protein